MKKTCFVSFQSPRVLF